MLRLVLLIATIIGVYATDGSQLVFSFFSLNFNFVVTSRFLHIGAAVVMNIHAKHILTICFDPA
jgi:hypothetical protein